MLAARVELVRSDDETRYIAAHIGLGPKVLPSLLTLLNGE
jgi:hypothetical protein